MIARDEYGAYKCEEGQLYDQKNAERLKIQRENHTDTSWKEQQTLKKNRRKNRRPS
ncbi:hypothetical protein DPMN_073599 [Dreissena polymorpha]|uniref:Uncharacterized protein n=1 Tax=Dreissena polymorpha TaxID=45954 RepID=A0A9D4BZI9_DREPO|nr:hypothetical protein DPMN_073599 [Dreissena polymorpha]